MRFIDLFAGLGGFHQALTSLGHECVFASENDPSLAELYALNFGIKPHGDIRLSYTKVPKHDILCAGFPCQPFSKAGDQLGFDCPQWGDLFEYVVRILRKHKPRYLIIENVPNLIRHDKGRTWKNVHRRLRRAGYDIKVNLISPHQFGVPQVRERAVIIGDRKGLAAFDWPSPTHDVDDIDIRSILDSRPGGARRLSKSAVKYVQAWQELLAQLPKNEQLPSFPIWAMEFGATYPYENLTPWASSVQHLGRCRGALGQPLKGLGKPEMLKALPSYAVSRRKKFPDWKIEFIRQNREFYCKHKKVIDRWLPTVKEFAPSFQKLEWNWKDGPRNLWKTIIQFRASGIRAKRPNAAPSLVALTTSQVPVIPWERRYMTMRECARLQSMGKLKFLPDTQGAAYRALGNAVNVKVIATVVRRLTAANLPSDVRPLSAKRHVTSGIQTKSNGVLLEAAE